MYGSGPGMADLHGARVDPVGSKIDFSLLQRQSASQEKHGSMGDSSISLLGIIGPGDRRLCMKLPLHVQYRPFSVTSEVCSLITSRLNAVSPHSFPCLPVVKTAVITLHQCILAVGSMIGPSAVPGGQK